MTPPAVTQSKSVLGATLAVVSVAQALLVLDTTVVAVALPGVGADLDASAQGLSWVANAYLMTIAGGMLLWGGVGDRWGRKRCLLAGLALFVIGSAVSATAPDLFILIAGRGIQGIGAAAVFALGLSILTAVFPADRLPTAAGTWIAVTAAGMCVGPPLGAVLEDVWGWRSIFWINLPLALAAIAVGWWCIPESRDATRRSADLLGGLLIAAAVGFTVWGLHVVEGVLTGENPLAAAAVVLALAAIAIVAAAARERRASDPVLPPSFLALRPFRLLIIAGFLVTFSHVSVLFLESFHLQVSRGWDPIASGLALLPLSVGVIAGSSISSRASKRYGERLTTVRGLLVAALGMAVLIALPWGLPASAVGVANALVGFGSGLALPGISAVAMLAVPRHQAGVASAALNTARQLGGAIGVAVLLIAITACIVAIPDEAPPDSESPLKPPGSAVAPIGRSAWASGVVSEGPSQLSLALAAAFTVSALALVVASVLTHRAMSAAR